MHSKICSRCQFQVPAKKRLCEACGCNQFTNIEHAVAQPIPQQMETRIVDAARKFALDLADDIVLTAQKSARAYHQILRLIRGN